MTTSGEGAEWVEVIPGTSPGPLYQPAPSSQGDPAPQGSWRVHHGTSDGSGNKMGQYGIIWFTIIFSGLVLTWGPLYILVCLAVILQQIISVEMAFRELTLMFLIINQSLELLRYVDKIVPVPKKITDALKKLQQDNGDNDDTNREAEE